MIDNLIPTFALLAVTGGVCTLTMLMFTGYAPTESQKKALGCMFLTVPLFGLAMIITMLVDTWS